MIADDPEDQIEEDVEQKDRTPDRRPLGVADPVILQIERHENDEGELRRGIDDAHDSADEHLGFALHNSQAAQQLPELRRAGTRPLRPDEEVPVVALIDPQCQHRADRCEDERTPQRRDHADTLHRISAVIGSQYVQTARKDEPEPSLRGTQPAFVHAIGDPDDKRIGEKRITQSFDRIGNEQHRIVQPHHTDSRESSHADEVNQVAEQHRPAHADSFGDHA